MKNELSILTPLVSGNDRIKQAVIKYEKRIEDERAKVLAIFEKELKLAQRKQDTEAFRRLQEAKSLGGSLNDDYRTGRITIYYRC